MYGAKGQALVNSEADAGAYVALAKGNTTNGAMTLSTYQGKMQVVYMTQENIDANQNTVSKTATLMDESGNASFPGKVTASNGFGGNADSATKLATARTIRTNLASTSTASFNGTSNVTPGVTGILPVANGGTGNDDGTVAKLTTARSVRVNLASTSAVNFDGSANITPGVTGTLGTGNGGTGRTDGKVAALATKRTIDGVQFDGSANITHYGVCSTAAGTAAKAVNITGFTLATGASVTVRFSNANTAANPTLNVTSTGAKAIHYKNAAIQASMLEDEGIYDFVYDGTYWQLAGGGGGGGASGIGDFCWSYASSKTGWLLCNGAKVSRTTYAGLYAVIGTKFGTGDGSTTFNLPDMRGRMAQGANGNLGTVLAAGLPNITGGLIRLVNQNSSASGTGSGAFSETWASGGCTEGGGNKSYRDYNFNASRSSSIYGKSTTVQPPAIALNCFIKY